MQKSIAGGVYSVRLPCNTIASREDGVRSPCNTIAEGGDGVAIALQMLRASGCNALRSGGHATQSEFADKIEYCQELAATSLLGGVGVG